MVLYTTSLYSYPVTDIYRDVELCSIIPSRICIYYHSQNRGLCLATLRIYIYIYVCSICIYKIVFDGNTVDIYRVFVRKW